MNLHLAAFLRSAIPDLHLAISLGRSECDINFQSLQEFFSHPFLASGELLPSSPVSSPDASLALPHPASLPTTASGIMLPLSGPSSSGEEQLPFAMERQLAAAPPPRPPGGSPASLVRMASEPPTPVGKQVVVQPRQQREAFFTGQLLIYQLNSPTFQPMGHLLWRGGALSICRGTRCRGCFTILQDRSGWEGRGASQSGSEVGLSDAAGLRAASKGGAAGTSSNALRDSMEDEDDYVIIERTPSSSGSRYLSSSGLRYLLTISLELLHHEASSCTGVCIISLNQGMVAW